MFRGVVLGDSSNILFAEHAGSPEMEGAEGEDCVFHVLRNMDGSQYSGSMKFLMDQ